MADGHPESGSYQQFVSVSHLLHLPVRADGHQAAVLALQRRSGLQVHNRRIFTCNLSILVMKP